MEDESTMDEEQRQKGTTGDKGFMENTVITANFLAKTQVSSGSINQVQDHAEDKVGVQDRSEQAIEERLGEKNGSKDSSCKEKMIGRVANAAVNNLDASLQEDMINAMSGTLMTAEVNRVNNVASSRDIPELPKLSAATRKTPKDVSVTTTPDTIGPAIASATMKPPDGQGTTSGTLHTEVPQNAKRVGLNVEETSCFLSKSINTSFLNMVSNFDEALNNSTVQVGPYVIKPKLAPILEARIKSYGDIAQNCIFEDVFMRSCMLEELCDCEIIKELQDLKFSDLLPHHMQYLLSAVNSAEQVNLKVDWLLCRHNELMESVKSLRQYKREENELSKIKEVIQSTERSLGIKKDNMMKLESEQQTLESQLTQVTAEIKDTETVLNTVKSKYETINKKYLVDELI